MGVRVPIVPSRASPLQYPVQNCSNKCQINGWMEGNMVVVLNDYDYY